MKAIMMTAEQLAGMIDHTLLKPEATPEQVDNICREALEYRFASVCVNSRFIPQVAAALKGSGVKACSVIGFPLGAVTTWTKIAEAKGAIQDGAKEIDMVLWVGGLKSGRDEEVLSDIAAVVRACKERGAILKVILETACLTNEEILRACELSVKAKADFVKTSTGFGPGGATVEAVRLMSDAVKSAGLGVKASGGIRTFDDAMKMTAAGATRIGASSGVNIVNDAKAKG
jgi:deoxyribose-phosphate aldolase